MVGGIGERRRRYVPSTVLFVITNVVFSGLGSIIIEVCRYLYHFYGLWISFRVGDIIGVLAIYWIRR